MSGLYEWIRSLVFYLILMTMIVNLLPDKKYEKYLRLFVGMVFLILLVSPFADLTGMEEQAAEAFSRMTFQNDAKLLKREIEDADGKRMKALIASYKEAVETDMQVMAEGTGVRCVKVDVVLDDDLDGGTFGMVLSVDMIVAVENIGNSSARMEHAENATYKTVEGLKNRIGEYYGLKERDITIHLEDE